MRKKPIYILTDDLNFFYRVNKVLNNKKLNFKILNFWDKIPDMPLILLTTSKELKRIDLPNQNINLLDFKTKDDINQYILKVLAVYRLGYQDYDNLLFSIDPGLTHIGIVIFLDDYFLDSITLADNFRVIQYVKNTIDSLQESNTSILKFSIKLGKGLPEITQDLLNRTFLVFSNISNMKIYLIDESYTSKIKISNLGKKFPKHEAAALILSLRDGFEVNYQNYNDIFKTKSFKKENFKRYNEGNSKDELHRFSKIAEEVIKGEKSFSESKNLIQNFNNYE